jgi:hypothetical protein
MNKGTINVEAEAFLLLNKFPRSEEICSVIYYIEELKRDYEQMMNNMITTRSTEYNNERINKPNSRVEINLSLIIDHFNLKLSKLKEPEKYGLPPKTKTWL